MRLTKPSHRSSSGHADGAAERLVVAGREVLVSNPGKVLLPEAGHTKLDLVRSYLAVADGALRGAGGRPNSGARPTVERNRMGCWIFTARTGA